MKPNIIYMHSHDTGRYVQPYGQPVPTPNIQKFAEGGVLFRQAFCGNPTCSPSRACLLTGQSAHANGMLGLAHRGWGLNDYGQHIIHTLHAAGYTSVLTGVQHVAHWNKIADIGFQHNLITKGVSADEVACKWLREKHDAPFFLDIGFNETHRAFPELEAGERADYSASPAALPDTPETREDFARYCKMAKILDDKYGAVLRTLEETGQAENTLVIMTTDHGIAFPKMKCSLTDQGIGVLLIMRGPGGFHGGRVLDSMVSQIDLFPTVCDLLDIPSPYWLEGQSILPLVQGEAYKEREEIFAEVNFHAAYEPKRCVRTKRYKYIRHYDFRDRGVLPNCDDGLSKTVLTDNGWAGRKRAEERLYDLVFDPLESHNIAAEPEMAGVLEEMRNRLRRWMSDTHDPLLDGPLVAGTGISSTDVNSYSPGKGTLWKS